MHFSIVFYTELQMVNTASVLVVSDTVTHGSEFDLDCHVDSSPFPSDITGYIFTSATAEETICHLNANGDVDIGGSDHLVGRDIYVTRSEDTVYKLHIYQAEYKDTANYTCVRENEVKSAKEDVYVYSK